MSDVIITFKIMGESPDVDMAKLETKVLEKLMKFAYDVEVSDSKGILAEKEKQGLRTKVEPVAFGLKALEVLFAMDESKGAVDPLEDEITNLDGVRSCEVVNITRSMG